MIYIASPYSSPDLSIMKHRFQIARSCTMALIRQGVPAFSPIMYMHESALLYDLPKDAAFWHNFNMQFLRKADRVIVLRMEGWESSKGVQAEISTANHIHLRVDYFDVPVKELALCE